MNFRFIFKYFIALLLAIFCILNSGNAAKAQTVSGRVADTQNAPIINAEVNLINQTKTIAQTRTDSEGKFSIDVNQTQNSLLLVKAQGFASFSKIISPDFNEFLNVVLSPETVKEDVVVSITRTESRLNETPGSIVVLDREIIEQTAAQTIDDTLRQIAGFTLFRRSSSRTTNPTTQGANLRGVSGSGASRTSVLFDGVSLNDAFGGWTYWSRVPKIAVENAEVLRGGASAFYGSSALSGAINLETRKSDKPLLRLEVSGGTQSTYDGSLFSSFGKKGWHADFAIETFQTAGYIPIVETIRGAADANANSRHNSGFFTLGKSFGEDNPSRSQSASIFDSGRIFLRGNLFRERRENGTRLQNNRTNFRQGILGADIMSGKLGAFQFRAAIETQGYDQTFSGISADRSTENLTRIQRVPSQARTANFFWSRAIEKHAFSASFDTHEVRGFSEEIVINNNRATSLVSAGGREFSFGVFGQDFWRATKKLNLNFGVRFDRWNEKDAFSITQNLTGNQSRTTINFPARSESKFSPRVAALYQINDNFSVLGSFSKSFRAPTLNELYRAFRVGNVLTLANENLQAERATSIEAGLNFTGFAKRLNVRGNIFLTQISNPVVSVTLNSTPSLITRQRQNVGETRSKGVEVDADFAPASNLRFSASYLLVDSRVRNFPANVNLVGKFLPQIPGQQLTFQTFYRPQEKISLSLQGRISDSQFEDDLNTLRLRPFFTLDVFAAYRLPKNLEIFLAAENIFNNRYDIGLTPNLTVAAPTFVRLGLRFNLQ